MQKITIFTDGGARGNPGPAGAGAVILDEKGVVLAEVSDYLGEATNNIAEYEALIRALEKTKKLFHKHLSELEIDIRMDSELIVRQMNGLYKIKAPELKPRFAHVRKLISEAKEVSFSHIRREQNQHADRLVNEAIDRE